MGDRDDREFKEFLLLRFGNPEIFTGLPSTSLTYAQTVRDVIVSECHGHTARLAGFYEFDNAFCDSECATWHSALNQELVNFALVDDRYVVDPWPRMVLRKGDAEHRLVYDLSDPKDLADVHRLYGNPDFWDREHHPQSAYRFAIHAIPEDLSRWPQSVREHVDGIRSVYLYAVEDPTLMEMIDLRVDFREETSGRRRESLMERIREDVSYRNTMDDLSDKVRSGGVLYETQSCTEDRLEEVFEGMADDLRTYPDLLPYSENREAETVEPVKPGEAIFGSLKKVMPSKDGKSVVLGMDFPTEKDGPVFLLRRMPVEDFAPSGLGQALSEHLGRPVLLSADPEGRSRIRNVPPQEYGSWTGILLSGKPGTTSGPSV